MLAILALCLCANLFVSADGCCQASFPVQVPDRPCGFIVLHDGNVYGYSLKIWNQAPERYYQDSRLLHQIESGVQLRQLADGGQEFSSQPAPQRHRVLREYALNGFVYEFSVNYSEAQAAEAAEFLQSIQVQPGSKDASRRSLLQCSLILDGLASQLLDHRPLPQEQRCPAGGRYTLEQNGNEFILYCSGDHGLESGYPRIDQKRQVMLGPSMPLLRPDR